MSDYDRMFFEEVENEKEIKKLTKENQKLKEKIKELKKEIKELKKVKNDK
jgi:cell division protein FtsB